MNKIRKGRKDDERKQKLCKNYLGTIESRCYFMTNWARTHISLLSSYKWKHYLCTVLLKYYLQSKQIHCFYFMDACSVYLFQLYNYSNLRISKLFIKLQGKLSINYKIYLETVNYLNLAEGCNITRSLLVELSQIDLTVTHQRITTIRPSQTARAQQAMFLSFWASATDPRSLLTFLSQYVKSTYEYWFVKNLIKLGICIHLLVKLTWWK